MPRLVSELGSPERMHAASLNGAAGCDAKRVEGHDASGGGDRGLSEGGREGYGRPRERTEPFEFDAICMFLGDLHGYLYGYCMYSDDLHVLLHILK